MLGFLGKFFGSAAETLDGNKPPAFKFIGRQEALLEFFRNEKNNHHVRVFLSDLEPRDLCAKEVMKEMEIFLACAGNRLDLYVPPNKLEKYQTHRFINVIQNHPGATLTVLPSGINEMELQADSMVGSHGQTYMAFPHTGAAIFQNDDQSAWADLTQRFDKLEPDARAQERILAL